MAQYLFFRINGTVVKIVSDIYTESLMIDTVGDLLSEKYIESEYYRIRPGYDNCNYFNKIPAINYDKVFDNCDNIILNFEKPTPLKEYSTFFDKLDVSINNVQYVISDIIFIYLNSYGTLSIDEFKKNHKTRSIEAILLKKNNKD